MRPYTFLFAAFLSVLCSGAAHAQSAFNDPGSITIEGAAASGLIAVEPKVEAGSIDPGTNNSVIVQFRNDSGTDIEFKDVKLFPSSNVTAQAVSDQCSAEPLEAAAQCAVVMEVKGLQSGAFRVEVLARHTGRSRLVTATVSGTVEASENNVNKATDIEVMPQPVDFGTLVASRPIIRSVTVRNITSLPITINDVFIDAPSASGFDLKTDCKELVAGASCIASIVWSPVTKGPTSGALVVQHTGATGVATTTLTGEFTPEETEVARLFPEPVPGKGLLVASEEEIDFGEGVESQSSITVSLVNIGDAPLDIEEIELAGSEQGLKVLQQGCSREMVLEPTEACPLTISWSPSKSGTVIDDVRIRHSGARGVMVLPIRGTSTATVNVDSQPIVETIVEDMGAQTVVTTNQPASAPQAFTAPVSQNAGTPTLDGYSISSLSKRNAIINGPGGSRMVRNGQTVRLGGNVWNVTVTDEGVGLISGRSKVLLVFDRSLSAPAGVDVDDVPSSSGASSSSSTSTSDDSSSDTSTDDTGTDSGTTLP